MWFLIYCYIYINIIAYHKQCNGAFIVYDVTNEESFLFLKHQIRNQEQQMMDNTVKFLVGNKCDDIENKKISTAQGKRLANEYGMQFWEVSAKTGKNVENMLETMAKMIVKTTDAAKTKLQKINVK